MFLSKTLKSKSIKFEITNKPISEWKLPVNKNWPNDGQIGKK